MRHLPQAAEAASPQTPAAEPGTGEVDITARYRGDVRVVGRVEAPGFGPVEDAEVYCLPSGFGADREAVHALLTTRTDQAGYFEFPCQPDSVIYLVRAQTASHYGEVESRQADAISGRLVVEIRPVLYTRHVFVDSAGGPVTVPKGMLLSGGLLASNQFPRESLVVLRMLGRMGVSLPESETNMVVALFRRDLRPDELGDCAVAVPGYRPMRVDRRRRPLSDWPRAETVTLEASSVGESVLYHVVFPDLDWPKAWGSPDQCLDYQIFYLTADRVYRSVSRRCPVFALERGVPFTLEDQYDHPLEYRIEGDAEFRKTVVPAYPRYGMLEVRFTPSADSSQQLNAILRVPGDPRRRPISGAPLVPGVTRMGPLRAGEYEVTLERGFSTSALDLVRDLGTHTILEGYSLFNFE